ncbi:hypothetical protein BDY19DRAFT_541064 [Irpex rosettiformis]|uniref:Uncharacterized protein n=1 Tax=Irpex rosettiformis TaxID=378272 RepID=A0ACB8TQL3_9APHY|nr:hypothetical protein BDY19DRAFT_541064 [Irpex rosettiformis]
MEIAPPAMNSLPIVPNDYWYTESERSNTCPGPYSQPVSFYPSLSSGQCLVSDQPLVSDPSLSRQLVAHNPSLDQALPFTIPNTNIGFEDTLPLAAIPSVWIIVFLLTATILVPSPPIRLTTWLHRVPASNTQSGGTANPATSTSDHCYPPIIFRTLCRV